MYELGLIINGHRFILYKSKNYPPYQVIDAVMAAAKAIQESKVTNNATWFQELDGVGYSS